MRTNLFAQDITSLTDEQFCFAMSLARQLGDSLKEVRCIEVTSVQLGVKRGGENSPYQQGLGYPIELNLDLLDKEKCSLSGKTVWVFANTVDGLYKFHYSDHEESQDSQKVINEVVSHLVAFIKGF